MKSRTQLSTVTCNLYWAMHLGLSTRLYLWYISDTSHWKWAGPSLHCLSPNDTSLEPSWESHTQDGKHMIEVNITGNGVKRCHGPPEWCIKNRTISAVFLPTGHKSGGNIRNNLRDILKNTCPELLEKIINTMKAKKYWGTASDDKKQDN